MKSDNKPQEVRLAYLNNVTSISGIVNGATTLDIKGALKGTTMYLGPHGITLKKENILAFIPFANIKVCMLKNDE